MTTTPTGGVAGLFALIETYAEARHCKGHSSYNAQTAAARKAVKDALATWQATAVPSDAMRDAMRYRKLRGWMSGNVKESWQEVENMGALCAWESWDAMDEYLDSLSECNIGLMDKAPGQAALKQSRADLEEENERLREGLEEMVNTFCSVENVANEHYLRVL